MSEQYRVTSAGVNPAEDRAYRMRMYFIVMSLRVVCIASLFWVRGWWILVAAVGSVLLPWFAVLIANAVNHDGDGDRPDAPTPLELSGSVPTVVEAETTSAPEVLIVIDAPAERRKSGEPT
ncbi:DUF3099 domain-containing protein [Leucobacter sp. W1153]|uniref:DUF3099 domain-containing protein n=1 Tax=Leucobacter sp. W1153 TaxID=3439064 RepID=UPI003F309783